MNGHTKMLIEPLTALKLWETTRTFIDVGGGNGYMAHQIILKNKHLKGILGELKILKEAYEKAIPLADRERLSFMEIDFF